MPTLLSKTVVSIVRDSKPIQSVVRETMFTCFLIFHYFFSQGVGKDFIFSHHGDAYKGNTITWYDQQYNKRELSEAGFPALRSWESQRLVWEPEKSDFPIQGGWSNILRIYYRIE